MKALSGALEVVRELAHIDILVRGQPLHHLQTRVDTARVPVAVKALSGALEIVRELTHIDGRMLLQESRHFLTRFRVPGVVGSRKEF